MIVREVDGGQPLPWGVLRWADLDGRLAEVDPGARLDRQIWPQGIRCGIEADGGLDVHLLLWRGDRPCHQVDRAAPALRPSEGSLGHVPLDDLADRLLVAGAATRPARPAMRGADGPRRERFADEDGSLRDAVIGSEPLPPPDEDGRWAFLLEDGHGRQQLLGRLAAEPGASVPHLVSVDEDGAVRVHAGDPPLWTADSPAEMEHRPGMVYRHALGTPRAETDDHDNPFDGTH